MAIPHGKHGYCAKDQRKFFAAPFLGRCRHSPLRLIPKGRVIAMINRGRAIASRVFLYPAGRQSGMPQRTGLAWDNLV